MEMSYVICSDVTHGVMKMWKVIKRISFHIGMIHVLFNAFMSLNSTATSVNVALPPFAQINVIALQFDVSF